MNYKVLMGLMLVGMLLLTGCNANKQEIDCEAEWRFLYENPDMIPHEYNCYIRPFNWSYEESLAKANSEVKDEL